MICPKCGSKDQWSGAMLLGKNLIEYDIGCEDCEWMITSDPLPHSDAVDQAKEIFVNG